MSLDVVEEITAAAIEKAPEPTGPLEPSAEATVESSQDIPTKVPGKSHRAGDYTRKPGEKRGRLSNAEREAQKAQERAEIEAAAKANAEMNMQAQVETRARELTDYKVTGQQMADGFAYVNVILLGTEFAFQQFKDQAGNVIKDEREEFYKVATDMAEHYQLRKLPGWFQISLILTSYYGIRAAMPPVRQRFGGYFVGFARWFGRKWNGFFAKGPKTSAPVPVVVPATESKGA